MADTYNVLVNCPNCESQNSLEITKGTTKAEYLATEPVCQNCGCKLGTAPAA